MRRRANRSPGAVARLLGAAMALGAIPAAGGAQEPVDSAALPAGPTELVFEREVFDYPTYERRNPFEPLTTTASGPRFEQMRLRGIIYSPDPRRSVALLAAGGANAAAGAAGPTRRVRVGESWGNVRVLEIHRDQIVVEVEEFGLTERRVMQLERRRGQGGS